MQFFMKYRLVTAGTFLHTNCGFFVFATKDIADALAHLPCCRPCSHPQPTPVPTHYCSTSESYYSVRSTPRRATDTNCVDRGTARAERLEHDLKLVPAPSRSSGWLANTTGVDW